MSDMPVRPGQMPGQKPMMEQLRSPANPADAVMMSKTGQMGGTFGEVMERQYGVKWDDPVEVAGKKILEVTQNGRQEVKIQKMAGGAPGGPSPTPGGAPAPGGAPGGSPIADMMGKMGG